MKNNIEKIRQLQEQIENCKVEIRNDVYNIIKGVAEQHRRPKISKHMFIVNFSEVSGNVWDASFYDYERASEVLFQKLDAIDSTKLLDYIEQLYNSRMKVKDVCVVKYKTKVPCANVPQWSYMIEHTYPIKSAFIKEILDKLNAEL